MKTRFLLACLLIAAVLASGCTQQPPPSGAPSGNEPAAPAGGEPTGEPEESAYDQLEQELDQAIEDIDLGDLEDEMIG